VGAAAVVFNSWTRPWADALEAIPLVALGKCPEGTSKDSLKKEDEGALGWMERCFLMECKSDGLNAIKDLAIQAVRQTLWQVPITTWDGSFFTSAPEESYMEPENYMVSSWRSKIKSHTIVAK
jgi:hypothetical protein